MKSLGYKLWFDLLTNTLVVAIVVLLLIPTELTDEQLAQIKPGMTVQQVKDMLGEPIKAKKSYGLAEYANSSPKWITHWQYQGKFWQPSIEIIISNDKVAPFRSSSPNYSFEWISKHHLLWVQHHNGIVSQTWLFPIKRFGGGIQGCIDTIKQYWNDWWK